jgi:glyoxylase-like metal-dependent hydrolase (beta-lactamase superfamily II)/rhodanese-related sulfurtransferase
MGDAEAKAAPSIAPRDLHRTVSAGDRVTVLDLRDRDEVETWRIEGESVAVRQAPMLEFVAAEAKGTIEDLASELDLSEPVVVVCGEGEASDHVAGLLHEAGIEARNLAGGMEAWADLYPAAGIEAGDATIVQYHRPSSGCLSYLIASGDEAAVVDPLRAFVDRYVEDAAERGVSIAAAVDTHVHADHVSGIRDLAAETGARTVVPAGAPDRGLAFEAETIADGGTITVGEAAIEARHAPGHTSEMTALSVDGVLLAGDSLFLESVARPDLERGSEGARDLAEQLHDTLGDLRSLPEDTLLAPGHVAPGAAPREDGAHAGRLGDLRERLDLLGLDRGAFVERVLADLPPRPANHERIIATNLGHETLGAAEAFELELGPNNCAVS